MLYIATSKVSEKLGKDGVVQAKAGDLEQNQAFSQEAEKFDHPKNLEGRPRRITIEKSGSEQNNESGQNIAVSKEDLGASPKKFFDIL